MKRRSRRSTSSSTFILSVPATWLRKPSSLYCGMNSMPDLPSFSDCVTSVALLPIEDTTPRPVTTTRFIAASAGGRRGGCGFLEQADLQAIHFEGGLAIGIDDAIGDPEHQLA